MLHNDPLSDTVSSSTDTGAKKQTKEVHWSLKSFNLSYCTESNVTA